jgi:hypothetical protein
MRPTYSPRRVNRALRSAGVIAFTGRHALLGRGGTAASAGEVTRRPGGSGSELRAPLSRIHRACRQAGVGSVGLGSTLCDRAPASRRQFDGCHHAFSLGVGVNYLYACVGDRRSGRGKKSGRSVSVERVGKGE